MISISNYLSSISSIIFIEIIFIISLLYLHRKIAIKYNIFVALPEKRSSHLEPTPKGAGLMIVIAYLGCYLLSGYDYSNLHVLIIGIFIATVYGFLDDFRDRGAIPKLIIQMIMSSLLIFSFSDYISNAIPFDGLLNYLMQFIIWFLLVWFANAINFMDGIDGMLSSGSFCILLSISIILVLSGVAIDQLFFIHLLLPCLIIFLFFNFSKQKIFLGDSGSLFLGYFISFLVLHSLREYNLDIWVWLIVLSHFLVETTGTTLIRFFMLKEWYKPHKSHAYQNLARISSNHKKVTSFAILYNLFWLLPLAYFYIKQPDYAIFLFMLSFLPVMIFTIRYGPIFSSD
jgi:Fuc2NAc and GlcNAc transferase